MKSEFMGEKTTSKKSRIPGYLSLSLLLILVGCYFIIPSVKEFFNEAWNVLTSDDEARVKDWVAGFGWVGPFVIILAMILQMFLIVIPTILLMIVAILAFGPIWGSVLIFIAVLIASSVGYVLGRYLGSSLIKRLLGEKTTENVISFIKDYGFWAVVITRINPFLSNDAISFVAGILSMNYLKFISATAVGISPLILLIAVTGQDIDSLKNGLLYGSLGSLVVFGAYIWWDKKKQTKD